MFVRVVIVIVWSEGMCVLFAMWCFVLMLENRRLCLGKMCGSVPGVGCECIVQCGLGWTCC